MNRLKQTETKRPENSLAGDSQAVAGFSPIVPRLSGVAKYRPINEFVTAFFAASND
jgi:hypothetical protein